MPDLPQTRQSLLIRLKDRHEDAWVEFLEIYERAILEYVGRRGLQDSDARDVTQDVLAAVGNKVDSWNADPSRGKFRGWLFAVARNIAVDKIIEVSKKGASGGSQAAQILAEIPASPEQETAQFRRNYRRQLMQWAAEKVRPTVSDKSWQSFWLSAIEARPVIEIASELNLTAGNVYAAKFRIIDKIRKLVEYFDDSSAEFPLSDVRDSN